MVRSFALTAECFLNKRVLQIVCKDWWY